MSVADILRRKADEPGASEHALQTAFFATIIDIDDPRVQWIHAIPNGGTRDRVSAGRMVAEGVKSGVWDISLPFWAGKYPFGYIEFKTPQRRTEANGGLSANQVRFRDHCLTQGAYMRVVYTWQEGVAALLEYLSLPGRR